MAKNFLFEIFNRHLFTYCVGFFASQFLEGMSYFVVCAAVALAIVNLGVERVSKNIQMVCLLELYQYAYSFSEKEEGVFLDGMDAAVA